ncbi:MAG TPA: bifunctional DNA-formamidopyrimidine glycosylase/DNA-(apurinic or apyrimidinic site) lyase [Bryobacteraceae bacterium]|jgi:formamidopyrimidine-DNA glycosylase|nr:bifunctional DNA-formamidopyrimidine glycosylase/DNA-(apurinic or apyrimidinic site) lyase [Bryobacteraceae bacterium]
MPELPEVETVARSIAPLVGRRIVSAEFRAVRILRGGDPEDMAARLAGRRIAGVKRYGKFLVLPLEGGGYLLIHLGMTGRLLLGGPVGKHTHAILTLDEGVLLFEDSRQFGSFQLSDEFPARVARLGPEPLEVSLADFTAALKRHKSRIKPLLLNQRFLRGVGNIYADEALFRAGIHPLALAHRLRGERAAKLYNALREVLREAIDAGGSSISDYVDAQGRKGFFQFSHRIYQRTGEACVKCGTVVRKLVIVQRSSHFCPKCQRR